MTETLINKNCVINFIKDRGRPYIKGLDITDQNNDPSFFTRNIRGIEKAWDELSKAFTPEMKMYDCLHFLDKKNLKCHSYCAMD